jgi:hypothetical protein
MSQTQRGDPITQCRPETYNDGGPLLRCPITGYWCEGDLSHLCEDFGCARKGEGASEAGAISRCKSGPGKA